MDIEQLIAYLRKIQAAKDAKYVTFDRMEVYDGNDERVAVVR